MLLVVGASGRLGSAVTREVLAKGERVRAMARDPSKMRALEQLGAEVIGGDIRDAAALARARQFGVSWSRSHSGSSYVGPYVGRAVGYVWSGLLLACTLDPGNRGPTPTREDAPVHNSLHRTHDPDYEDDDFSALVAEALGEAYRTIKLHHGAPAGQLSAQALISPVAAAPMSAHQRMQVYYVQAMAALAQGEYGRCVSLLSAAGDLAHHLPDPLAGAELAYLRAATEIMRHDYADARAHFLRSLELLISARGDELASPSPDPETEASAILGVAGCDFLAARYNDAARYVELAQSLVAPAPKPITASTIAWLRATLDRWRGDSAQALRTALAAADAFAGTHCPGGVGQLLLLAALCALDLAEPGAAPAAAPPRAPDTIVSASWLAMAQPLIERTVQHARASRDAALEGHALLAKVRYGRIAISPPAVSMGMTVVEAVIVRAERLVDPVLLCEALTERAHQYAAQGAFEVAAATYREVQEQAREYGVLALGTWAQRSLERMRRAGVIDES